MENDKLLSIVFILLILMGFGFTYFDDNIIPSDLSRSVMESTSNSNVHFTDIKDDNGVSYNDDQMNLDINLSSSNDTYTVDFYINNTNRYDMKLRNINRNNSSVLKYDIYLENGSKLNEGYVIKAGDKVKATLKVYYDKSIPVSNSYSEDFSFDLNFEQDI